MVRPLGCAVIIASTCFAGAALAQPAFDIQPTLDCIGEAGEDNNLRLSCVGTAADACMADDSSTVGMTYCLEQEFIWWDRELNVAYQASKEMAAESDAALSPPLNVQGATLLEMQRAWIPFRDARCRFEAVLWQGGTGAGAAQYACLMIETARQTMVLGY
ncbi:lysozyme inhibitor LprI family protein [Thioclava sp. FR2]|uniref:lysozyme inhibitor LprI family protein n=1 Tax=Thioclava sp. FR2 TaxID=3445780 RepID=UPI003EB6EC3B